MRIVVATSSYPGTESDASGHFVRAHARRLARGAGAEVTVIAPGARGEVDVEAVGSGSVLVVRTGGAALFAWPGAAARARERPARLLAAPAALVRAAHAARTLGPFDRAVAHWIVPSAFPVLAGVDAPLEIVAHGADVRLLVAAPAALRSAIVSRVLARSDRLCFVAASLRDELARALPWALARRLHERATIAMAPIDLPDRGELGDPRASLGLAAGTRYAAWVGRVVSSKRPLLALEAARAAGLVLVFTGDGPGLDEVRASAARAPTGGPALIVTGRLPRSRALAIVAAASVLLHTSMVEGAPTVVREARALGVPVVACPAGDLAAWARLDPGIEIAAPSPTALAAALGRAVAPRTEAAA